ncbi:hypothetical protein SKAU_G00155840 [Synaphobranchus kaupii]|uniref:Uncharacterized protein n=1 Tax=Synaphobranchus kaupii TaxID=118154 RepID=A0A9Q1FHJ6_SYNKA|nr:hypothetical protein SKAU_G00155840 [Synaphobranchus kaupii]
MKGKDEEEGQENDQPVEEMVVSESQEEAPTTTNNILGSGMDNVITELDQKEGGNIGRTVNKSNLEVPGSRSSPVTTPDEIVPRFDSTVREELELVLTPDKETAGEEESGESDVEEPEEVAESEEEDITDSLDTAVAEMGPTQVEDESAPKKEGREASQIPQPAEVEKTTQATVPETSRVSQEGPDAETGRTQHPLKQ